MAEDVYDHKEIEPKWQKRWTEGGLYRTENSVSGKENFYTLVELPYPSGDLHVGHWAAFSVPDIFARMRRMQGYNVLYPIGFDSFGLPAENAAIKHGADPAKWTGENIDRMRGQLKQMGNMFDWEREVSACDPSFYKWTQWLFLQLFKKGLAYKKKAFVNWDPVDKTVLANEQVLPDGTAERSGAKVEKKELAQWFLKITDYADRLIDDLDALDWPEPIKEAQRNWIGRSEGAEIDFPLVGRPMSNVTVFTTRPDTLFGATYLVLAPEHPLIEQWTGDNGQVTMENKDEVIAYVKAAAGKSELFRQENKEKTGVLLEGVKAINPATKEEIPIFIADYVLSGYGTGAIMAVPAHDERDFEFAKKFDLPIRAVLKHENEFRDIDQEKQIALVKKLSEFAAEREGKIIFVGGIARSALEGKGDSFLHSDIDLFVTQNIVSELEAFLNEQGLEEEKESSLDKYHWKDKKAFSSKNNKELWVDVFVCEPIENGFVDCVSGEKFVWQEYGKVINVTFCGSTINVPEPMLLEKIYENMASAVDYLGDDTGAGILIRSGQFSGLRSEEAKKQITEHVGGRVVKTFRQRDWLISRQRYWGTPIPIVYDPKGNAHAVPDEHLPWLLPTDVDFTPTGEAPLARSKELKERTEKLFGKGWTPEVDTMDTFVDSSWYFLRYLDPKNEKEFCSKELQKAWMPVGRYSGGAEHTTMHILYSRFFYKALFDLGLVTESEPYKVRMNRGLILAEDGRKMSKRWGNVVNPDTQVANVGADSVKMYLAFIGPYNEVGSFPWNTNGLIGVRRFLERVWNLHEKVEKSGVSLHSELETLLHQTIKKVGDDIESMKFNTSVSALMIFSNEFQKLTAVPKEAYEIFLKLLAPFAPHMTEELWERLGHSASIHLEPWPEYDPEKATANTVSISVQINGKTRGTVLARRSVKESELVNTIKNDPKLSKYIDFKPKKVIFVPDRIINFVA